MKRAASQCCLRILFVLYAMAAAVGGHAYASCSDEYIPLHLNAQDWFSRAIDWTVERFPVSP